MYVLQKKLISLFLCPEIIVLRETCFLCVGNLFNQGCVRNSKNK